MHAVGEVGLMPKLLLQKVNGTLYSGHYNGIWKVSNKISLISISILEDSSEEEIFFPCIEVGQIGNTFGGGSGDGQLIPVLKYLK